MFTPPFAAFAREEKKEVFIKLLSKKGYHDFPLNQDCLTFDLC
jgi:hypothetical protein